MRTPHQKEEGIQELHNSNQKVSYQSKSTSTFILPSNFYVPWSCILYFLITMIFVISRPEKFHEGPWTSSNESSVDLYFGLCWTSCEG